MFCWEGDIWAKSGRDWESNIYSWNAGGKSVAGRNPKTEALMQECAWQFLEKAETWGWNKWGRRKGGNVEAGKQWEASGSWIMGSFLGHWKHCGFYSKWAEKSLSRELTESDFCFKKTYWLQCLDRVTTHFGLCRTVLVYACCPGLFHIHSVVG